MFKESYRRELEMKDLNTASRTKRSVLAPNKASSSITIEFRTRVPNEVLMVAQDLDNHYTIIHVSSQHSSAYTLIRYAHLASLQALTSTMGSKRRGEIWA